MPFNLRPRAGANKLAPAPTYVGWWTFLRTMVMLLFSQCVHANPPSETEIKFVYLYNFTKFVTWPTDAFPTLESPFRLCIFGEHAAQTLVDSLRSKTTAGRQFDVLYPKQLSDIASCHIAFLHRISTTMSKRIVRTAPDSPTLLVSDMSGFAGDEGIIEFVVDEKNRVRIKVNLVNANKRKLTISAKLLEIATHTYR